MKNSKKNLAVARRAGYTTSLIKNVGPLPKIEISLPGRVSAEPAKIDDGQMVIITGQMKGIREYGNSDSITIGYSHPNEAYVTTLPFIVTDLDKRILPEIVHLAKQRKIQHRRNLKSLYPEVKAYVDSELENKRMIETAIHAIKGKDLFKKQNEEADRQLDNSTFKIKGTI